MSTPLIVAAILERPSVGLIEKPFMLDGPLAWAVASTAPQGSLPPATREHVPDMDLPLERWDISGVWGWCTSAAVLTIDSYTAVEIRRKPATGEMARFTSDRKHHSGLGPYKARDTTVSAAWVSRAVWEVLATDRERLESLLAHITHLGAHANIGYGLVSSWRVEESTQADGWKARPLPNADGIMQGIRAPYYHPSRRTLAS